MVSMRSQCLVVEMYQMRCRVAAAACRCDRFLGRSFGPSRAIPGADRTARDQDNLNPLRTDSMQLLGQRRDAVGVESVVVRRQDIRANFDDKCSDTIQNLGRCSTVMGTSLAKAYVFSGFEFVVQIVDERRVVALQVVHRAPIRE